MGDQDPNDAGLCAASDGACDFAFDVDADVVILRFLASGSSLKV